MFVFKSLDLITSDCLSYGKYLIDIYGFYSLTYFSLTEINEGLRFGISTTTSFLVNNLLLIKDNNNHRFQLIEFAQSRKALKLQVIIAPGDEEQPFIYPENRRKVTLKTRVKLQFGDIYF